MGSRKLHKVAITTENLTKKSGVCSLIVIDRHIIQRIAIVTEETTVTPRVSH